MASILEANVDNPTTFRVSLILVVSSSVLPSTSKSPLASILPVNVDAADTKISSKFDSPSTSIVPLIV